MRNRIIFGISIISIILFGCNDNNFTEGRELYKIHCTNCHQDNGQGLMSLYPPLAFSDYLKENQKRLPCLIKNGLEGPIVVNGVIYDFQKMQGFPNLNDFQINNIISYINSSWGNSIPLPNIRSTQETLSNCEKK